LMYCYFAAEKATTQSENLLFDILWSIHKYK
jgi:hypothetical protein